MGVFLASAPLPRKGEKKNSQCSSSQSLASLPLLESVRFLGEDWASSAVMPPRLNWPFTLTFWAQIGKMATSEVLKGAHGTVLQH